jgi:hypothetical protein
MKINNKHHEELNSMSLLSMCGKKNLIKYILLLQKKIFLFLFNKNSKKVFFFKLNLIIDETCKPIKTKKNILML